MMIKFYKGQRIIITEIADCVAPPPISKVQLEFPGRTGTISSLRRKDNCAWAILDNTTHRILVSPSDCMELIMEETETVMCENCMVRECVHKDLCRKCYLAENLPEEEYFKE